MSTERSGRSWHDQLLRAVDESVVVLDLTGVVVHWGDGAERLYGWTSEEAVGTHVDDLVVRIDDDVEDLEAVLAKAELGEGWEATFRVRGKDRDLTVSARTTPLRDERGEVLGMIGVSRDVTALRRTEAALAESEVRFQRVFDESPVGTVLVSPDLELTMLRINPAFARMLGYEIDELLGRPLLEVSHPDDLAKEVELGLQLLAGEISDYSFEKRLIRSDGGLLLCRATATLVQDDEGRPLYGIGMAQDITAQAADRETIRTQKERLDLVLDAAGVCTWELDLASGRLELSDNAEVVFGLVGHQRPYDLDEFYEHVHAADRHVFEQLDPADGRYTIDFRVLVPGQGDRWIRQVGAWVVGEHDEPVAIRGTAVDATERRAFEQRLATRALTDELTGLPNRALLLDRLRVGISHLSREVGGPGLAVLFVDVDRFKVVNESLGHRAGDELLVQVARRLGEALPDATVTRFGADEFVVLVDGIEHPAEILAVAQLVFDVLDEPFRLEGRTHHLSVSIGIVSVVDPEADAEAVLRDADAATSKAKAAGGGRYELFDQEIREVAVARLEVEDELRRGIGRGELEVRHQPVVRLDGQIVGFEALVRWQHPTRGLVSPDAFIPVAEETGLIVALGREVLHLALGQLAEWRRTRADSHDWTMAVNVSSRQLVEAGLVEDVAEALEAYDLPGRSVRLELTESALMSDLPEVDAAVAGLRRLGVRLSVDDFGTGYSSMMYLRRFPVDVVKLDRAFVRGVADEPVDRAIVGSMVALAHDLGMEAVAEGVETLAQLEVLRRLGCDAAQGFYWSGPEPAAVVEQRLLAGSPGGPTSAIVRGASV